ncbi:conjugal transfer protein TraF [Paraferrimonas sp. SM1919]|uniref:conjugal transfer protein TraF n=1 Tax=Paraferrimonas sp. SM1919 TaxID=2662263 RepID=UPI0013D0195A|nr:conjugal transfer protein TraF [Paraferrimonas sp. SM1919]
MNFRTLLPIGAIVFSAFHTHASELSYLYKDSRVMAMGGANIANGGLSSSVFSNPAGITSLKENDLHLELIGAQLIASKGVQDVVNDINEASELDDATDILVDVFAAYSGERFHGDISNFSSLSYNHGKWAWSLGLLAVGDGNITPHANGASKGFLETQSRAYGGAIGTLARKFSFVNSNLSIGASAKFFQQKGYEGTVTAIDLIKSNDVIKTLDDKLNENGSAFSFDIGARYSLDNYWLKPTFGASVLNIGKLDFNNRYGTQPMTVNLGAAFYPDILSHTEIALDYIDLLNANNQRYYHMAGPTNIIHYTDVSDTNVSKRFRAGIKTYLWKNTFSDLELGAGYYQGNITGGIHLRLSIFRVGVATYMEQLGPNIGDYDDRRYMANIAISM